MLAPEPLPLEGLNVTPAAASEDRDGRRWSATLAANDRVVIHAGDAVAPAIDAIAAPDGYVRTTRDLRIQLLNWLGWNRDDLALIHDAATEWRPESRDSDAAVS